MEEKPLMQATLKGRRLTIVVEIEKEGHQSSTGKSTLLYSSGGFQWPEGLGVGISLNVIKSKRA
jgi:hypothetical protein